MTTNRKNIRAEFHDYSGGDCLVTVCTSNKEHYLVKILRSSNMIQTIETQQNGETIRPLRSNGSSNAVQTVETQQNGETIRPLRSNGSSNTVQTIETHQNGRDARLVRPVDVRLVRPETQQNGSDGEHGEMILSTIGRYCREQMESISAHYPYAAVSVYVIMPNHIHAIITVNPNRTEELSVPSRRTALSVVMGGLKRAVTMYARRRCMRVVMV